MKASLQFRLSQHLAMTPQLQQSIRLLQLSTLELNQEIEQAMADNPLLERDDDPLATAYRIAADGAIRDNGSAPAPAANTPESESGGESNERAADDTRADDGFDWPVESARGNSRTGDDDNDEGPDAWAAARPTLAQHLREQLGATKASPRDRALVDLLIEALDDRGYLSSPLDELLALLPPEADVDLDDLNAALRLLQSFDPAGVGARCASECLRVQLESRARSGEFEGNSAFDPAVLRCAIAIVSEHLPLLAARDFTRLKKVLNSSDDQLRAAQQLIRGLNPHPGVGFAQSGAEYVVPDVTVRRRGSRWIAQLNSEVMPRLRLNADYAALVKRQSRLDASARRQAATNGAAPAADSATEPTWSARVQEARWLIRNIQQRFETIERVAQAIVDRQQNFFTHGAVAMRPLVLREIADTVALHESTISRVTTGKYMATPFGVFEFKYFFGSHVATESGGAASSTAIRALIKQLIGAENPKEPLSDSQIAELLGKQGIVCARRTVAKYRELLQIPPVAQRRAL